MLATRAARPFHRPGWIYEEKVDGWRMLAYKDGSNLVLSLVLAAPLAGEAQYPAKVPLIGVLWPTSDNPTLEAFRHGLRDLGYVEGQNIAMEYRYAGGKDGLPPDLNRGATVNQRA